MGGVLRLWDWSRRLVGRRVLTAFISHTSELRQQPAERSFVSAARDAVLRAHHAVSDMGYFTARDSSAAHYCISEVEAADVYMGIIGVQYGTPVTDRPAYSRRRRQQHRSGGGTPTLAPMSTPTRDWAEWHERYEDPESPLSRRLRAVQRLLRDALDGAPPGPVRVVSFCAGQGRDLIGALDGHPRHADVHARLVELDTRNVAVAQAAASAAGLDVEVAVGDAALTEAYVGAVPADLVLLCGVFGNVSDADVEGTIGHLPGLCGPAATVIWTRHRRPPDLTPRVREWFARAGFVEIAFEAPSDALFGIGVHRLRGDPAPLPRGLRLFTFVS